MIPKGFCQCGCGRKTWIATKDNPRWGHVKGEPVPYARGHGRWAHSLKRRLWSRIEKRGPDDCWLWTGAHTQAGYGVISKNGHMTTAHRVVFELTYGSIPDNHIICHTCDNPRCCNPAHLFLGTDATNSADKVAKGREGHPNNRGRANPNVRLTAADVHAIREAWAAGGITQPELATCYGVQAPAIWKIVHRRTWKHI